MRPDRFARLKELVLKAADLSGEERRAFLDESTRGDPELRREAEAMLAHDGSTRDILKPGALVARLTGESSPPAPPIGQTISHYRILQRLGEGGMGEVYRAEDTKLGRLVALKFIRRDKVGSSEMKARFLREAHAAAALDHPNICAIHAMHEWEDHLFLEMAFVEGQTLQERIARGPLAPEEALGIASQVASGLEAAHAQGIVHRDIKPSNIMLSRDGRTRILDFGLARSTAQSDLSRSGVVMGTVGYMSPEQARGQAADHRTDIWSLGVVLYEMLTGQRPFRGENEASVMHAILYEEPEPVTARCPQARAGLERICRKALAKSVEDRYQRVSDLATELEALRRGADLEAPTAPKGQWDERSRQPRRWGLPRAAGLAVLAAALAAGVWWRFFRNEEGTPVIRGHSIQVTGGGTLDSAPAVSPDGGRIAYASDRGGNADIYVVDIHGNSAPLRLTNDPAPEDSPAWFPDGTAIAFVSGRGGGPAIWKVGQFGGGATLLVPDAIDPAISPDGSRIAFSRAGPSRELRIAVTSLASPAEEIVLTGKEDGLWDHRQPAWAPDGRSICYAAQDGLWVVPATGGPARRLTFGGIGDAHPCWFPAGDRVCFSSCRERTWALWSVGAGGGRPQRLTLGSGYEVHPSVSRDGRRLVYATRTAEYHVVLLDLVTGEERELPDLQHSTMMAVAPDMSSIVFVSERSGVESDLWLQPLDQGHPAGAARRLTEQGGLASCQPVFSPDGKWIAYYRNVNQQRDVWTVPIGGGRPIQFTSDPAQETLPAWSPDGSHLAFVSDKDGGWHIWIAPVREGRPAGPARRLTDGGVEMYAPSWSPDGALVAFVGSYENGSEVGVVPSDGSADPRQVTAGAGAMRVRWQGISGTLIVSGSWGGDRYLLRRVYLDGRQPADFSPPIVLGSDIEFALFDVSADGHLLARSREENVKGAIWVLEAEAGIR